MFGVLCGGLSVQCGSWERPYVTIYRLQEMEVRGEIRNPVDYLVQLLETEAFKENTIDTSWLDGLLKEKNEVNELTAHEVPCDASCEFA